MPQACCGAGMCYAYSGIFCLVRSPLMQQQLSSSAAPEVCSYISYIEELATALYMYWATEEGLVSCTVQRHQAGSGFQTL